MKKIFRKLLLALLASAAGCAMPQYSGSVVSRHTDGLIYHKQGTKPLERALVVDRYPSGRIAVKSEILEGRLFNAQSFDPSGRLQAEVVEGNGEQLRFREVGTISSRLTVERTIFRTMHIYDENENEVDTRQMNWGNPPPSNWPNIAPPWIQWLNPWEPPPLIP